MAVAHGRARFRTSVTSPRRGIAVLGAAFWVLVLAAFSPYSASPNGASQFDVPTLLDTYASGSYDSAIQAALLPSPTLIPDLRAAFAHDAPAWAAREGPEHLARRRLIAATFVIDFSHAIYSLLQGERGLEPSQGVGPIGHGELFVGGSGAVGTQFVPTGPWIELEPFVEWACAWLRKTPPTDPLERDWFLASVQLYRDFSDPSFGSVGVAVRTDLFPGHLGHAESRFPAEPWFRVVSAERQDKGEDALVTLPNPKGWAASIAALYQHTPGVRSEPRPRDVQALLSDLLEFRRALTPLDVPAVRAEVHVHLGCIALLCGERDRALQYFADVDSWTTDPCLQYLGHFMQGRVDDLNDDRAEAERQYEVAIGILPTAPSALTALSVLRALDGDPAAATQLAKRAVAVLRGHTDPWVGLLDGAGTGCTRWPLAISALREGLRKP
jgi:hypothetical protein